LQQRQQDVQKARSEVEAFKARQKVPQKILRLPISPMSKRDSPLLRRARIKEVQRQRLEAKKKALSKIAEAEQQNVQLQTQIESAVQEQQAIQQAQSQRIADLNLARKYADRGQFPVGESSRVQDYYREMREGQRAYEHILTEASEQLGVDVDVSSPLVARQKIMGAIENKVDILKELGIKKEPSATEKLLGVSFLPSVSAKVEAPPTVLKMPTIGEKIRGSLRKYTDISLPSIEQTYREIFRTEETRYDPITPLGVGKDILKSVPRSFVGFGESVAIGTSMLGVEGKEYTTPEIKFDVPIAKPAPDKKLLGDKWDRGVATIYIPSKDVRLGTPRQIGFVAGTSPYFIPPLALAAAPGLITEGVETFQTPKPQEMETIDILSADEFGLKSTDKEYKDYVEDVKERNIEIEEFNKENLKQWKALKATGLITAATGGLILGGAAASKSIRFLRTPVTRMQTPKLSTVRKEGAIVFGEGEKGMGLAYAESRTPAQWGIEAPRYKWLMRDIGLTKGIKNPKIVQIGEQRFSDFQVFGVEDSKAFALAETGQVRPPKIRFSTIEATAEPVKIGTFGFKELPKIEQFVARKLPMRSLPEDVSYFITRAVQKPRVPIGRGLELESIGTKSATFFKPTRPPTVSEVITTGGVARVIPKQPYGWIPKGAKLYNVEEATKRLWSVFPRRTGKVTVMPSEVLVIPMPKPSAGVNIMKSLGKQSGKGMKLTAEELAVKGSQIAGKIKLPKPKTIRVGAKTIKPAVDIKPVYSTGAFAGKGLYERTQETSFISPTVLPPQIDKVFEPSRVSIGVKPTVAERIGLVPLASPGLFEITDTRTAVVPSIKPGESVVFKERIIQKSAERLAVVPRTALAPRQILRPSVVSRPIPRRPTPKVPKSRIRVPVPPTPKSDYGGVYKPFKRKKKELATPFVRRFGKWVKLGKPVSKEKALKIGISKLRRTLAASLKLQKEDGEIIPIGKTTPQFRPGKSQPTILVQKASARLGTRGEVAEIIKSRGGIKWI
jgi:hypothetical protein